MAYNKICTYTYLFFVNPVKELGRFYPSHFINKAQLQSRSLSPVWIGGDYWVTSGGDTNSHHLKTDT